MPDDLAPAFQPMPSTTPEPSSAAPAAPSIPEAIPAAPVPEAAGPSASDKVYDAAIKDLLKDDQEGDAHQEPAPKGEPPVAPVEPVAPKEPADTAGPVLSESEEQALRRAGFEPEDWKGWDRTKIEARVTKLRQTQSEQDRVGSELDRLKKAPPAEEKPKEAPPKAPSNKKLGEIRAKLVEAYDEDINPLLDVIDEIDQGNAAMAQQAAIVPLLSELVGEIVLDQVLGDLVKDYPSIAKPDARTKVTERFWQEWNTGAYSKQGVSLRQQLASAATNAAKVTFVNATEQSAAATLVTSNKARIAAQPRTSPTQARSPKSLPRDDVYDQAFQETLAPELRGAAAR